MDIYKSICKKLTIPLWAAYEKSPYLKHMKYLEASQYVDFLEIKKKQWTSITKLLNHAYKNIEFYRKRFDEGGIHPNDIKTWADFSKIPFLTKDDVRTQRDKLFSPHHDKYIRFYTSGSTGIPVSGYRDKHCNEFKRACGLRSSLWSGYEIGDRIYCLYGNPDEKLSLRKKVRRKLLTRERFLDTLDLSEESMMTFARLMQRKQPGLLWGHAHNMYILASFLENKGIVGIRPKGMYSAGMVLHDWERDKVENVFGCAFQDRYGCEEIGLIAAECKKKEGLHINTDDLYVEFIGKNGYPVDNGRQGQIVVTDLHNFVMPLIRYKMGDIGIPSGKSCSCGRTQPLITKIEGRVADFIITPEGKAISGISLTDHFGASIPGVAQIQIVQEKINNITLNVVKADSFGSNSLEKIDRLVKRFFGRNMKYRCEYLDKIPQESSGKYRFSICKIDNPFF